MKLEPNKIACTKCHWVGLKTGRLQASNPFDETNDIYGCPNCKEVNGFVGVCDEPKCKKTAVSVFYKNDTWRKTCTEHAQQ